MLSWLFGSLNTNWQREHTECSTPSIPQPSPNESQPVSLHYTHNHKFTPLKILVQHIILALIHGESTTLLTLDFQQYSLPFILILCETMKIYWQ